MVQALAKIFGLKLDSESFSVDLRSWLEYFFVSRISWSLYSLSKVYWTLLTS